MEYNNYKNPNAGNNYYGLPRLKLAKYVCNKILNKLNLNWFIENGTLLGAWRNNKFIKHDDDFDVGMIINSKDDIIKIHDKIKDNLPNYYDLRIIDTYCNKIEIFDASYGKYNLLGPKYNNSDYHYVTLDLQFYLIENEKCIQLYNISPSKVIIDIDNILPTNKILLENNYFNCPNNIDKFLKAHYGSLSETAKYCEKTGKYIE